MATVEIKKINKSFGSLDVLKDIDVRIEDGEFVALVGPSGCGKSTMLRCLAGLEDLTSGDILFNGKSVIDVAPSDRQAAMVFQSYALYPHKTVRDNLGFALRIAKKSKTEIDAAVKTAAEMLNITELLEKKPRQLSGGQRQRVAIGRAIVRKPEVFLFDEPLSNLDTALRGQMRVELSRLHKRLGATMIYVTHDQIEAMTMADRIVLLDSGSVRQMGTPMDLFDRPNNIFVAQFIGSPSMNILPVEILENAPNSEMLRDVYGEAFDTATHFGVRPEDVSISEQRMSQATEAHGGKHHSVRFEIKLEISESLGREMLFHGNTLGAQCRPIIIQTRQTDIPIDHSLSVCVAMDNLHLFDGSGSRITLLSEKSAINHRLKTTRDSQPISG